MKHVNKYYLDLRLLFILFLLKQNKFIHAFSRPGINRSLSFFFFNHRGDGSTVVFTLLCSDDDLSCLSQVYGFYCLAAIF